jgi:hypothetical protein
MGALLSSPLSCWHPCPCCLIVPFLIVPVVVSIPPCCHSHRHPQSILQAVACRHASRCWALIIIMEVVTRQLAPNPPCKQGFAVVGGRCCGAVLSSWSPCTWHCSQDAPHECSHEAAMGCVAVGSLSAGSTCDPPYEQLLIRLEMHAGSIFHVESGHHVSVTWHQERHRWCVPDRHPHPWISQCPSHIS